jgi:hypothetical protein
VSGGVRERLSAGVDWLLEPQRRLSVGQLTALVLAVGIARRVWRYALGFPLWGDEAFVAVDFVLRDYAALVEPLTYGQIVPLAFMWATLAVTKVLGLSEWALRLIPFACGLAGLLLFWRFVRGLLTPTACLLALSFLAGAFYVVRHSAELKAYSVDLLCSVALAALVWRLIERPRAWAAWTGLILMAGVGVWCSYPFVFIACGGLLALGVKLGQQRCRPGSLLALVGLCAVVLAMSFAAMYAVYASPHAQAAHRLQTAWSYVWPPVERPWLLPIWFFKIHLGRLFALPHGGVAPGSAVTFALFVVGGVYLWRRQPLLVVLLVSPFLLNMGAAAIRAYPYGGTQRIAQHLAPAICLLAGQGLWVVLRWWLRNHAHMRFGAGVFAIGVSLYGIGGMVVDVIIPYATPASKHSHDAVRDLAEASQPTDTWVIFNARHPVEHAPYLGDWRGIGGTFVFDVMRFPPNAPLWSPPPEQVRFPAGGGDVWLLAYFAEHDEKVPEFPQGQLDRYLERMATRLGSPVEERKYFVKGPERPREAIYAYRYRAGDVAP